MKTEFWINIMCIQLDTDRQLTKSIEKSMLIHPLNSINNDNNNNNEIEF